MKPETKTDALLPLAVVGEGEAHERAEELARHLGAPLLPAEQASEAELLLVADGRGLSLSDGALEMTPDLADMLPRLRQGKLQHELLVRAARIKGVGAGQPGPLAVDATAGLGTDSLLLAASGFQVLMFEWDPVIAALLADALRRALADPRLVEVASRMRLMEGDSIRGLRELDVHPDVVYLDPMFPERQKSAAVKKKFQLLHKLERPCADPEELLQAALAACPRKIVVKRPVKGPLLAGVKPSYSIAGKAVRYDCIVP